jgi:3'-5' exoribonuclease
MEVIDLCLHNAQYLTDERGYALDKQKIYLAALFHDVGKIWDYEPHPSQPDQWRKTRHSRIIHHISKSASIWKEAQNKFNFIDEHDEVFHAILSHHGRREYGSPVSPATRIAWLLHLCDSISARMFDCYSKEMF